MKPNLGNVQGDQPFNSHYKCLASEEDKRQITVQPSRKRSWHYHLRHYVKQTEIMPETEQWESPEVRHARLQHPCPTGTRVFHTPPNSHTHCKTLCQIRNACGSFGLGSATIYQAKVKGYQPTAMLNVQTATGQWLKLRLVWQQICWCLPFLLLHQDKHSTINSIIRITKKFTKPENVSK